MKSIALLLFLPFVAQAAEPIDLGPRWELFVDEHLVAEKNGVTPALKGKTVSMRVLLKDADLYALRFAN
jgi:hypothetical protein